jgi:hypothetical protein
MAVSRDTGQTDPEGTSFLGLTDLNGVLYVHRNTRELERAPPPPPPPPPPIGLSLLGWSFSVSPLNRFFPFFFVFFSKHLQDTYIPYLTSTQQNPFYSTLLLSFPTYLPACLPACLYAYFPNVVYLCMLS